MTLKQKIRLINRTEDADAIRRLVDHLRDGKSKLNDGTPVLFDYADMLALFTRCEPSIDPARFDYLMRLADDAPLTTERIVTR